MTKHRDLDPLDPFPASFPDGLAEFVSTVTANLVLRRSTPNTVAIGAGPGNDQVAVGIMGRWRWITAQVEAAHPGGAAGTYDVYVTAADNAFVGSSPETDNTDYSFGLVVRAQGAPPVGVALYRRIGEVDWTGAEIAHVRQLLGARPDDIATRERLQLIRGTVQGDGSPLGGRGFTVVRNSVGIYTVSFVPDFEEPPAVAAMSGDGSVRLLIATSVTAVAAQLSAFTLAGALADTTFVFVAIGRIP